jgi:hypothetical protein
MLHAYVAMVQVQEQALHDDVSGKPRPVHMAAAVRVPFIVAGASC